MKATRGHYVIRREWNKEHTKQLRVAMHAMILGVKGGDHADPWNTLDNRRKNLRPSNRSQNAMNRRTRSDNTSGRKGVCPYKEWYLAYLYAKGNKLQKHCKTFEEACKVREEWEQKYHGEFARAR
jgi:hypothetical protein